MGAHDAGRWDEGQSRVRTRGTGSQDSGCLGWEWAREEDKATLSRAGFETNINGRIIFASAAFFSVILALFFQMLCAFCGINVANLSPIPFQKGLNQELSF